MEMKPVFPGMLVKDCLAEYNLSIAAGAKALGITRQQLNNVVTGRSAITPEMAVRLEMVFGGKADMWMRMQTNYDLDKVRSEKHLELKRLVPAT